MAEKIITVSGLVEVQRSLYAYSQRLGDFVVLKSLRAGAEIIRKEAQANAPIKTSRLKRGIVIRKSKIHRGKLSGDLIGVYLTILKKKKDAPFYGRFQEDGWNTRGKPNAERGHGRVSFLRTRRSIDSSRVTQRGKTDVPGKKFIDGAYISKREEAVDMIVRTSIAASEVLLRKVGL
jgi:hypothetical protein